MSSEDFFIDFDKGKAIFRAFRGKGVTPYQATVLRVLYQERSASRDSLKEAAHVRNNGQLSNSVIIPLVTRGYILRGDQETDGRVGYSILPEGSKLVEEVMEETGYSKQSENPA